MLTRPNRLPSIQLYGVFPSVPGCEGPTLSQDKGLDTPCCARCYIIRQRIYREKGMVYSSQKNIEYLEKMGSAIPEVSTCYVISKCGKPVVSTNPYNSELEYESVRGFLQKQFLFRQEERVACKTMSSAYVGMTSLNKPVVLSQFQTDDDLCRSSVSDRQSRSRAEFGEKVYESFGGDDGIEIVHIQRESTARVGTGLDVKYIVVKDLNEAYKSGKWMHVINFYQLCEDMFGDFIEATGDIIYETGKDGNRTKNLLVF